MRFVTKINVVVISLLLTNTIFADQITVVSYGGENTKAQNKAFYEPYIQNTNHTLKSVIYSGDLNTVKGQIAGNNNWQVVEVEGAELVRGCDAGIFELLSLRNMHINSHRLIKGASNACGVGFFIYSNVLAYNSSKLTIAPNSWQDFWNTDKFPGKRGLRKHPKTTLEFALLADGVNPQKLYQVLATKEGQDRAFAKLDQLKSHIMWWQTGQQAADNLANGQVVMSSIYNGRITEDMQANKNINFTWQNGLYEFEYWAIPKGAKKQQLGHDFIASTVTDDAQKTFMQNINYGGTNKKALDLLSLVDAKKLPTAVDNLTLQQAIDLYFWVDNGAKLEQRFNEWLVQ